MKIERINENQIRCTLSNFDLSVRNVNLNELAYGSEKARNLFREMIQRAANGVGFEAEECVSILFETLFLSWSNLCRWIAAGQRPAPYDFGLSLLVWLSDTAGQSISFSFEVSACI